MAELYGSHPDDSSCRSNGSFSEEHEPPDSHSNSTVTLPADLGLSAPVTSIIASPITATAFLRCFLAAEKQYLESDDDEMDPDVSFWQDIVLRFKTDTDANANSSSYTDAGAGITWLTARVITTMLCSEPYRAQAEQQLPGVEFEFVNLVAAIDECRRMSRRKKERRMQVETSITGEVQKERVPIQVQKGGFDMVVVVPQKPVQKGAQTIPAPVQTIPVVVPQEPVQMGVFGRKLETLADREELLRALARVCAKNRYITHNSEDSENDILEVAPGASLDLRDILMREGTSPENQAATAPVTSPQSTVRGSNASSEVPRPENQTATTTTSPQSTNRENNVISGMLNQTTQPTHTIQETQEVRRRNKKFRRRKGGYHHQDKLSLPNREAINPKRRGGGGVGGDFPPLRYPTQQHKNRLEKRVRDLERTLQDMRKPMKSMDTAVMSMI
jgi:hypothetical protein